MVAARSVIHLKDFITHSESTQQVKLVWLLTWLHSPNTFSVQKELSLFLNTAHNFGSTTFGGNIRNITKMG